jgi:hypothetical protein
MNRQAVRCRLSVVSESYMSEATCLLSGLAVLMYRVGSTRIRREPPRQTALNNGGEHFQDD